MANPTLAEILAMLRANIEANMGFVPRHLIVSGYDGEKLKLPIPKTPPPPSPAFEEPARHSPDFRSVHWFGHDYTFTPTQGAAIRALWEAWDRGTPDMGIAAILEAAGSEGGSVRDIFRSSPAWGSMIVATGSSNARTYRLNQP